MPKNVATYARTYIDKFQPRSPLPPSQPRPLRIGYASHCFRHHSVGWLARWIYEYHDRQNFQIFTYFVATPPIADSLQQWYHNRSDGTYFPSSKGTGEEIFRMAERIYDDKIDILIDLDSLTLDGSCELMALRAAPIQATWLGWDASSVPTIDYFIADPYVLPDDAQDYYHETIWRLPQTYIAVEGFETAVPSLRRDR
ncbi:MAG: hypothetical protein HC919_04805 [Oscillatoriales cyanobacterium SM2_2_1]|nr:hypothetical protein [Oscillatoriales cyanobacterium SM2_2_1]